MIQRSGSEEQFRGVSKRSDSGSNHDVRKRAETYGEMQDGK